MVIGYGTYLGEGIDLNQKNGRKLLLKGRTLGNGQMTIQKGTHSNPHMKNYKDNHREEYIDM